MGKIKSFSSCVKDELAREIPERVCCQKTELYTSVKISGHIKKENKNFSVKISTENASIARRIITLIRDLFGSEIISYIKIKSFKNKGKRYFIEIPFQEKIIKFLKTLGYLDNNSKIREKIFSDLIRKKCCQISFLKSCFYNNGYILKPQSGYHLEIIIKNENDAKEILKIFNKFRISPKMYRRRGFFVIYLKRSEDILNFLKLVGAYRTVLDLENIKILKETKSYIKRLVNFESANLKRTIEASHRHINNIEKIENYMGIDLLTKALRDIAYIRLEYPQASLLELGKLGEKKISKSAVNNRLRRINEIAKSL